MERLFERTTARVTRTDLAESALTWLVGGADVMRGQLEHLATLTARPSIEVQVL